MKTYLLCLPLILTAACEVQKTPVPTGGSRSDASVDMSYEVLPLEKPVVDWASAESSATKRCNAWGYSKADPFEGVRTQCQAADMYGNCNRATVTKTYQCTG